MRVLLAFACISLVALASLADPAPSRAWDDYLLGNPADAKVPCQGGLALMGGAADPLEEAFRWLLSRAPGGDVVVLSQYDDSYNALLARLGQVDSVETIVIHRREAACDPELLARIDGAEILFFGGGDQSRYLNLWKDTPLLNALNRAVQRGAAIGGTSAGLAILGEFCFSAWQDTVTSEQALADPFDSRVTLETDFLRIPLLKGVITDSHFSQRERMGRLAVFLARLEQARWVHPARGLAVDETTALLVEPDGDSRRVGQGSVHCVQVEQGPERCRKGEPLEGLSLSTVRLSLPQERFNLKRWEGDGARARLQVNQGRLEGP